jgi:hypothetical protein
LRILIGSLCIKPSALINTHEFLETIFSFPETYLSIKIIRLHCKCPGCAAGIIIETDPKNIDYRIVNGAKRGAKMRGAVNDERDTEIARAAFRGKRRLPESEAPRED